MINIINTLILIFGLIILKLNVVEIAGTSPIGEGLYNNKLFWFPSVMIFLFLITHIVFFKFKKIISSKSYYNFINISVLFGFLICVYFLSYNVRTIYLILLAIIINDIILNIFFNAKRIAYLPIFFCLSLISTTYLHLYSYYGYNFMIYLDMSLYPLIIKEYISLLLFYLIYRLLSAVKINKFIIYMYTIGSAVMIIIGTNYILLDYEKNKVEKLDTPHKVWMNYMNRK